MILYIYLIYVFLFNLNEINCMVFKNGESREFDGSKLIVKDGK